MERSSPLKSSSHFIKYHYFTIQRGGIAMCNQLKLRKTRESEEEKEKSTSIFRDTVIY